MLIQSQDNRKTYRFCGIIETNELDSKHYIRIYSKENGWVTVGVYTDNSQAENIHREIVQSYVQRQKKIYYCPPAAV